MDLFAFCCSFWFFVPAKSQNEQCDTQMKTSTKNQHEQQKTTKRLFIHSHQFWTNGRWLISRALRSQKKQRRERKSNEKQQKATKSNKKQQRTSLEKRKRARKTKTGMKKLRRATKGTKSPNGNQALTFIRQSELNLTEIIPLLHRGPMTVSCRLSTRGKVRESKGRGYFPYLGLWDT